MQKLTFFNYRGITNIGEKSFDLYIDGYIVDADTQSWLKCYGDETSESYKSIREQIQQAVKDGCNVINCYINSGGGYVIEAMAIHDYFVELQNMGIAVNTFGRGIIASASTYILMAGNSSISENSWFMIHNVSGGAYGDVNEVEKQAVILRKFNDTVVAFYAKATGISEEEIGNMMNQETWLTGTEAKEKGFVKNCTEIETFTNSISEDQWVFNNKEVLTAYNSFTNKNQNDMDIKKIVMECLQSAGLIKNKADEPTFENAALAIANSLQPIVDGIGEQVTNAVNEAMKNYKPTDPVDISNLATKEDIKTLTEELNTVKEDVANKAGSEASTKEKEDKPINKHVKWETSKN